MVELRIPSDTGVSVYHCSFHCHLPFFGGGGGAWKLTLKKITVGIDHPLCQIG